SAYPCLQLHVDVHVVDNPDRTGNQDQHNNGGKHQ
ncbi:hypothetical protein D020_0660B, partial [Vibrio parahaemolyticus SBR10290]